MAAQKTAAEDLTEGKFSYPIIVALEKRQLMNDDQVLSKLPPYFIYEVVLKREECFADILRQRTKDVEVKMYCVELLRKRGAFKLER